jgi:hypothetical protein
MILIAYSILILIVLFLYIPKKKKKKSALGRGSLSNFKPWRDDLSKEWFIWLFFWYASKNDALYRNIYNSSLDKYQRTIFFFKIKKKKKLFCFLFL